MRRFAVGERLVGAMPSSTASEQARAIRAAASQFLQTLAPSRRERVVLAFPSGQSPVAARFARSGMGGGGPRPGGPPGGGPPGGGPPSGGFDGFVGEQYGQSVWSNFPVSDVPRPGVRMGELGSDERGAVHALLRVVLSPMGYQKVLDIMAADQTLADSGVPYAAGLDVYTVALFGPPSATTPWMLQFGGHHLGLNVTFVGDRAVCAPLHTGILPARFEANGRTVRGLGRENDTAFDLVASFTSEQLRSAMIDHDVSDLVCGPGRPDAVVPRAGLRGADMTDAQRNILFALAREWVGMLNDAHSAQRLADIHGSLGDTWFAWSGPTTHEPGQNGESYFRLHGPSLVIEHAPQGNQGGYRLHVHTVMRDMDNDYGRQLLT
jgi:hypothetical protein